MGNRTTDFPGGTGKINFPLFYNPFEEDTFKSREIFNVLNREGEEKRERERD